MKLSPILLLWTVTIAYAAPNGTCPEVTPEHPVYLRDTIECGFFYQCSNGEPYRFRCPHGLYWDQEVTVCNRGVDCDGVCPERDDGYPVYLSDTVECAVFYECSNGEAVKLRCPSETYWDIELDDCDKLAECGDLLTTPGLPTGPTESYLR